MLTFNKHTPVLFLVFNRPDTTALVFEEIKKAQPKRLYIAADGPRNAEEQIKCNSVREIVSHITWDCEVKTLFREKNLGCKYAVSGAIDWFFEQEPEGIILEDDCLPSQSFFGFCSTLLEQYRDDDRIGHIGGANFQQGQIWGDGSYYFSRLTHVWGWASWRRVWDTYDVKMESFEKFTEDHLKSLASHADYRSIWFNNLKATYCDKVNTWDYQYAYCNLINNRLSIISNQNLITNIGFGEDATHTREAHPHSNLPSYEIDEVVTPLFYIPSAEADLFTQSVEHPLPIKKNFFSRTWKKIKKSLRTRK